MADDVERAKALEDLQHALTVRDVELGRDALRRLRHDLDLTLEREKLAGKLTDREKVDGLRGLVVVELVGALEMRPENPEDRPNLYVDGRIASYELVLDAIGRRWPDLNDWQGEIERIFEHQVGMTPPPDD